MGAQILQPPTSAPALCSRPREALHSIQPPCQQESRVPRNCSSPNMPFPLALRWDTHPITASRAAHSRAGGGLGRTTTSEAQKLVRTAYPANPGRGEAAPPHSLCPEGLWRCPQTQLTPPKRAPHKSPSDWYVCVCSCMCAHVCMHVCEHACMCTCVYAWQCAHTCALHVCARACVYTCPCVPVYVCACVVMHVCACAWN